MDERAAAAARLVGSVRGAVAARRDRVHDVDGHEQVHWLAELPGEIHVQIDAGPGHVLFSMPAIALSPPAPLGEEFDSWLTLRRWYRVLRSLADEADNGDNGDNELVLAVGLLTWRSGAGRVRDHLLTTPVRIVVDRRTERVDVVLGNETMLRDADLLGTQPRFDPAGTEWVGDAVRTGQGFGLRASVADVLRKWCTLAFDEPAVFREDWAALAEGSYQGGAPRVRLSPALVLRKRERAGVLDYFDAILADLARPGADAPAGLAHLFAGRPAVPHPVHDPLFPLPAESAERKIMAGLRDALPVEGRLTTRSLANLGAALLAESRRVLFVTPRNVRDALPPEIAELFGARPTLSLDPVRHKRIEAMLEGQVSAARAELAKIRERAAAASGIHDMVPGYQGTVAEIAERVAERAEACSWLPPGLPAVPPITAAEARELHTLLTRQTPKRAARTAQVLPDPSSLPAVEEARELIKADRTAQDQMRRSETELSRRLWACELAVRAGLSRCAISIRRALHDLGQTAAEWDTGDWSVRALAEGLAGRNMAAWEQISGHAPLVSEADRAVRAVGFQSVRLSPDLSPDLLPIARRLRSFLVGGGRLKRGPMKPEEQRRAEPLLSVVRVDGEPPTTAVQLDVVIAEISGQMACRRLAECWSAVGVGFSGTSMATVVDQIAAAYVRLGHVRAALAAVKETAELLSEAGLPVSLASGPELFAYLSALDSLRYVATADRAAAAVTELAGRLEHLADEEHTPPELPAAIAAVKARDADTYAECLTALRDAHEQWREQARCDELLARLPAAARSLLTSAPDSAKWPARLAVWDEAWAWSAASGFLTDLKLRSSEGIEEAASRERAAVAELIAARARRLPGGTPACAVLLEEVTSVVEPIRDAFDVVIVDEADATDVSALFLLWLAPRVIAVGFRDPATESSPMRGSLFDVLAARCGPVLCLAPDELPPVRPEPPVATIPDLPDLPDRLGTLVATALSPPAPDPSLEPAAAADVAPPQPVVPPSTAVPQPFPSSPRHAPVPPQSVPPQSVPSAPPPPVPSTPPPPVPAEPRPEPPSPAPSEWLPSSSPPAESRPRSIVTYARAELVNLVARVAADGVPRDDDELVESVRRLLNCPDDEELLVGARLHYAVTAYRQRPGTP